METAGTGPIKGVECGNLRMLGELPVRRTHAWYGAPPPSPAENLHMLQAGGRRRRRCAGRQTTRPAAPAECGPIPVVGLAALPRWGYAAADRPPGPGESRWVPEDQGRTAPPPRAGLGERDPRNAPPPWPGPRAPASDHDVAGGLPPPGREPPLGGGGARWGETG